MDPSLVSTSKFLSLVLRHRPQAISISLDDAGWVAIPDLLEAANAYGKELDLDLLLRVVHENNKQRFAISPDGRLIRANQGHSVEVDLGLSPTIPPAALYHGTAAKFLHGIHAKGLLPGNRQHVHLSADLITAEVVGKRRGEPIVLTVDAQQMADDAIDFFYP